MKVSKNWVESENQKNIKTWNDSRTSGRERMVLGRIYKNLYFQIVSEHYR